MLLAHAQDLGDLGGDLLFLGDHGAVGQMELGIGLLLHHGAAPLGGTQVAGVPANGIGLPVAGKFQLHEGWRLRGGVLGAEEVRVVPCAAAGLAVEGIADGVKNSSLARAGVAGDQVQSAGAQGCKIQHALPRVGSEGGYGQLQRSHASSFQIDSISPVR